jgi:hypothetical protein
MPYRTIHMQMDGNPYVYQRNFHIQLWVIEVVHSDYPGKNTKVKH